MLELLSVSLAFVTIVWGGGGASIRHGAFFRGGRLKQTLHPQGVRLLDTRRLFESGCLLDH